MLDSMLRNEGSQMNSNVIENQTAAAATVAQCARLGTPEWDDLVETILDENHEALEILAK